VQLRIKKRKARNMTEIRTICQQCHIECGVIAQVNNGEVVRIKGDPRFPLNRGKICPKGMYYTGLQYHPQRLRTPLKKTDDGWKKISWDEALDLIAEKLSTVWSKHGSEAVALSVGTQPRGNYISTYRLASALDTPNVMNPGYFCYYPSVTAGSLTFGADVMQERGPDIENTSCILMWGANPLNAHPPVGWKMQKAKIEGRAKLIVVDPRRTRHAQSADIWLQLRPGTDDALALGMLNVIVNEELYDRKFVNSWCVGFDELAERVQEYDPARVAEITWIPEKDIREAARLYAGSDSAVLYHRVAVEHHANAIQTLRALAILIAVTGNIDSRGGNVIPHYPKGFIGRREITYPREIRNEELERKRIGAQRFPLMSGAESFIPRVRTPDLVGAILKEEPYPIKAMIAFNNPVVTTPNSERVWKALERLDFLVVVDLFLTPTAELADVVLPTATWLERNDIADSGYTNYIAARKQAVPPVGECVDDKEIVVKIAERLGRGERIPWKSTEDLLDMRLKPLGMSFEEFKRESVIVEPLRYHKYESSGFATQSGKVELFSQKLARLGYDPLPYYRENPFTPVSTPELYREYPLILITGHRHIAFYHSENRQIEKLRALCPDPLIEIHPSQAEKLGVNSGDWLWIESPGIERRIKQRVKVTDRIHPKVVAAQHGWWFPEQPGPEHGAFTSNIDVIMTDDVECDPICGAVPVRGTLCRLQKVQ
jgi:anaerobic selenocysteine-containing dehydrogenase